MLCFVPIFRKNTKTSISDCLVHVNTITRYMCGVQRKIGVVFYTIIYQKTGHKMIAMWLEISQNISQKTKLI